MPPIEPLLRTMALLAIAYVALLAFLHLQSDSKLIGIFGGSKGFAILNHPDRIEAYRVGKLPDNIKWQEAGLADFPTTFGPVAVSSLNLKTLIHAFSTSESYDWEANKACIFIPGVRFDSIRGSDRLSLLVCFKCDYVEIFLNARLVGGGNTDKMRPTLVRLAKSLFPDDATIQSLSEKNGS